MMLTMSDQRMALGEGEGGVGEESRTVRARAAKTRPSVDARGEDVIRERTAVALEDGGFEREDGGVVLVDDGSVVIRGVVLGEDATTRDATTATVWTHGTIPLTTNARRNASRRRKQRARTARTPPRRVTT